MGASQFPQQLAPDDNGYSGPETRDVTSSPTRECAALGCGWVDILFLRSLRWNGTLLRPTKLLAQQLLIEFLLRRALFFQKQ
jgi:hypothetical protein